MSRLTIADWLAHDGVMADFEKALRLEPGDESLLAGYAVARHNEGDLSLEVDAALRRAVAINPFDSQAWMTLGLRAEARGEAAEAERDLTRAANVDRTFKPSWTLANYCFRAGCRETFRRAVARCFDLIEARDSEPMSFDPAPVFDLCWRESQDSVAVLELVPQREQTLVPYLRFLYETGRTNAALEAWPAVLQIARRSNSADVDTLLGFADYLIRVNFIDEASAVWKQLADQRMVGDDIGAPLTGRGFAWHLERTPGVFSVQLADALKFELTGNEPEDCVLLWRFVPVSPAGAWRAVWKVDASGADAGLRFEIADQAGGVLASCRLIGATTCGFEAGSSNRIVRLALRYTRIPGTTPAKAIVALENVRMEPPA